MQQRWGHQLTLKVFTVTQSSASACSYAGLLSAALAQARMVHAVCCGILYVAREPDESFGTFSAHSPLHTGDVRACLLVRIASPHPRRVYQDLESSPTMYQLPSLAL